MMPAAGGLAGALMLAMPVAAQDMGVIAACATSSIGAPDCDALALAEALGLLSGGQMRPFADFGMESFAMLTALRYASSAIFFQAEGEGCVAEEERTAAVEIWSLWVRLPDTVPQAIAERFAIYDGVMDNVIAMEVEC